MSSYLGIDSVFKATSYLEHYGILGMKWGIRKEYESKGQKNRSLKRIHGQEFKYQSKAIRILKDIGKQTLNYTLAALIPGYSQIYNARVLKKYMEQKFDNADYLKKDGKVEKLSELKKKNKNMSADEDCKIVNNNGSKEKGRVNNCSYCTLTYEMRRRGYDVTARHKAYGMSIKDMLTYFDNSENRYKHIKLQRNKKENDKSYAERSYKNLTKEIEKNPNGSRGYLSMSFGELQSGHVISWEIKNNKVTFYDGQSGKSNINDIFSISDQDYTFGRLDDLKVLDKIGEACVSNKKG